MKHPRMLLALLAGLMLILASTPAVAITYGEPDGDRHPYVGTIFVDVPEGRYWICSGSLVSPTVFVTAGHCTDLMEQLNGTAYVTFAPVFAPGMTLHPVADVITGPNYSVGESLPTHGDIGVLIMQSPMAVAQYAELPTANLLDALATERGQQDQSVTIVGYGTLGMDNPNGGRPGMTFNFSRNMSNAVILNLRSNLTNGENVQVSGNPGQDRGGACFGDSGGPVLLDNSNVIIGINSFVLNYNCAGTVFAYRTDIADARAFLSQFVELP